MADPEVGLGTMARACRLPATVIPATDPDSIERTSAGIARKDVGDAATGAMIGPEGSIRPSSSSPA